MKRFIFQLHHPAHYHLFKGAIRGLREIGHSVHLVIKRKDVLEELLLQDGVEYTLLKSAERHTAKLPLKETVARTTQLIRLARELNITHFVGSTADICIAGRILGKPSIVFFEDDLQAVPYYAFVVGPLASEIVCPDSCSAWHWDRKAIKYPGYHELAYLHPDEFSGNAELASKLRGHKGKYVLLRFSSLAAYHDRGKSGITNELAYKIIDIASENHEVWVISERELPVALEMRRLSMSPLAIHHAMKYASLYIGDSQTMAAEAAVLGTPSIRYNDFVNKLGYLNELENRYGLTKGIVVGEEDELLREVKRGCERTGNGLAKESLVRMLKDKINVSIFMTWFLDSYPGSVYEIRKNEGKYDEYS